MIRSNHIQVKDDEDEAGMDVLMRNEDEAR